MFEGIIGQEVTTLLTRDITGGDLPPAILLHGPRFSGKLSVALEIARVLNCRLETAERDCPCPDCERHRQLLHPALALIGTRYFLQEIVVCANTLRRVVEPPTLLMMIRAVRKLLRRCDPVLWQADARRFAGLADTVSGIEERLAELTSLQGGEDATRGGRRLSKLLDTIIADAHRIASALPNDGAPVHLIRNISFWARHTSHNRRLVIIENVDRLREHSCNALLKIVEEPPTGLHFALLTTRRSALMATILSRTRSYALETQSQSALSQLLHRVFHEQTPYDSLDAFFSTSTSERAADIAHLGHDFFEALAHPEREADILTAIERELREDGRSGDREMRFLEALLQIEAERFRSGLGSMNTQELETLEKRCSLIQRTRYNIETLNIGLGGALVGLLHAIRTDGYST